MKQLFKRIVVSILTTESKIVLRRHKPTIVAITGSVGKTSTKDAIYAAIKDSVPARKNQKSFNSEIGVPLTILGLQNGWSNPFVWLTNCLRGLGIALFTRTYPKVLVLETGVDQPGDMAALAQWLSVDIMVVTRLPEIPVHVEFFVDPEAMRNEEFGLIHALKPDGVLVYNADDVFITNRLTEVLQRTRGFSRMLPANVHAAKDEVVYKDDMPSGIKFALQVGDESYPVTITGTTGLQSVYASAAALAVALELEVRAQTAVSGLSAQTPPAGRMRLLKGLKSSIIIDDTYNASPVAVEAALESLQELKYVKRRIAVLGDMLELGRFSAEEHRRVGEQVAKTADILLTVGPRARGIAEAALAHGMDESVIFQYEKSDRAGRELQMLLKTGDAVLVKASQSIRAEKIVKEIMAEPERAAELLVRQDTAWNPS